MRWLLALSIVSLVVFVGALISLFVFGGQGLRIGLALFLWIRVAVEALRTNLVAVERREKLVWQALNFSLHVGFAAFCTWAMHPWY